MQKRRLATIMPVLRSLCEGGPRSKNMGGAAQLSLYKEGSTRPKYIEGGPVLRSICEGGFNNIIRYATLTDGDADRAIEMLCRHREILRPAIDKHKG